MNKYSVFLGSAITAFVGGYGLMYGLLSSENKLGKARFAGEFWGGVWIFTVMGIAIGLLAVKTYPHYKRGLDRTVGGRLKLFLITLQCWLPLAALAVATVVLGKSAGFVNKDNGGLFVALSCFLAAVLMVAADKGFESTPVEPQAEPDGVPDHTVYHLGEYQ